MMKNKKKKLKSNCDFVMKKKPGMKLSLRIFFLLILFLSTINLSIAQECCLKKKNVPQVVLEGFKIKYPDTKVRGWEKTKENSYKAKFAHNDAVFSSDGKWMETRIEIKIKELPREVTDSIAKTEYRTWKIHTITKLETSGKHSVLIIQVEKGNDFYGDGKYQAYMKTHDLYYTLDGNFIKKIDLTSDSNIW